MQNRKKDQKESGWKLKDPSRSYNKAKHSCTRRTKAIQIIQLCWEKQRIKSIKALKALKVTMNISRKRVSS